MDKLNCEQKDYLLKKVKESQKDKVIGVEPEPVVFTEELKKALKIDRF